MDYVLFQAAELLKEGLIREWAMLSPDEIKALRAYLLSYVINHPALSGYIRERIVQVCAIAIKRQSVDDLGEDRRQVLNEVSQLITGSYCMYLITLSATLGILFDGIKLFNIFDNQ